MLLQRPVHLPVRRVRQLDGGIFNIHDGGKDAPNRTQVGSVFAQKANDDSATEHWVLFPNFVSPTRESADALVIERVLPSQAASGLPHVEGSLMEPETFLAAMYSRARSEGATYTYIKAVMDKPVELGPRGAVSGSSPASPGGGGLSPATASAGRRTRGLD